MENLPGFGRTQAVLNQIFERLVSVVAGGKGQPPAEGASVDEVHDALLLELNTLSDAWDGREKEKKKIADNALWDRLLDACYKVELESLKLQGWKATAARRLVRREQAWWEPDSRKFVAGARPPAFCRSVPVVVVQQEAGFRIHGDILARLWDHPVFADGLTGANAGSASEIFENTLGLVESIAQDYCFDDLEYLPSPEELEGPDRWALACWMDRLSLHGALEAPGSIALEAGDRFFDDQDATPGEDLAWLIEAKRGDRLWWLLNAAVKLGRSLNQHETFRDSKIQDATRKMLTAFPGKGASPAGTAVELIISKAADAGLSDPTPGKLLEWLKGKRPNSDGDPLIVTHLLWGSDLGKVSWEKFENLVKRAKSRVKSTPSAKSKGEP
jgi:hypothetical protein